MPLQILSHAEGAVLPLRVQPGARTTGVLGEHAGMLKVAIHAPAQDGRANEALLDWLRGWLGVRRSEIALITGATARQKSVLFRGWSPEQLSAKIQTLLAGSNSAADATAT